MLSFDDIEYFKNNFNIDLTNKTEEEIEVCLEEIEENLNRKIIEAQKENLQLEKEIIQILNEMKTDS